jgi:hypothetical protein
MTKLPINSKLCQMSKLPFQAFRWKAGAGGRYKETIVSSVVARDRNICQACLNDLQFGLPVGVRNSLMKKNERDNHSSLKLPTSTPGLQQHYHQIAQEQQTADYQETQSIWNESEGTVNHQLALFSQRHCNNDGKSRNTIVVQKYSDKTAFRNLPKLCSFWLNGTCSRVVRGSCPYRPCCGTFVFPEIAGERDLHTSLVARLQSEGAQKVMTTLNADTRQAIHNALKGNREEAIRKRVAGDDDLTKKYVSQIQRHQVSSSELVVIER